jgi:hypothetical protein
LVICGNNFQKVKRLRFYSLVFYWITAVQVAFISSTYQYPTTQWYEQSWLTGFLSIILQFAFLAYFYAYSSLKNIVFPKFLYSLQTLTNLVHQQKDSWVFYPLIISMAIFLYWSFESSVLTLLWVVECFMIFSLSLLLRAQQFRYVAMIGLAACLLRLIFYDMAQAGTLTKALVFLGVGGIMLLMHTLYKRYKSRFL